MHAAAQPDAPALTTLLVVFLGREPDQPIVLVAPPDRVAALIWGLTRVLPASLQTNLTFSVYERHPGRAGEALITGVCPGPGLPVTNQLLAGAERHALIIDLLGSHSTSLPQRPAAADYASVTVAALTQGIGLGR